MISFMVEGKIQGKARARTVSKCGRTWSYTPKSTMEFENRVRLVATLHKPDELLDGAIRLKCMFCFKRPKSIKRDVVYKDKKPDIDNCLKAVIDGMEGIIYTNDSRIAIIHTWKYYTDKTERVEITIEAL